MRPQLPISTSGISSHMSNLTHVDSSKPEKPQSPSGRNFRSSINVQASSFQMMKRVCVSQLSWVEFSFTLKAKNYAFWAISALLPVLMCLGSTCPASGPTQGLPQVLATSGRGSLIFRQATQKPVSPHKRDERVSMRSTDSHWSSHWEPLSFSFNPTFSLHCRLI